MVYSNNVLPGSLLLILLFVEVAEFSCQQLRTLRLQAAKRAVIYLWMWQSQSSGMYLFKIITKEKKVWREYIFLPAIKCKISSCKCH